MSGRFLLLGDLMADITARIDGPLAYASDAKASITMQPGGSAANTAAWLAHLGEAPTLIGCLGEDDLGTLLAARLLAAGIEVEASRIPDAHTGICIALVDAAAERSMLPDAGANARLRPEYLPESAFSAGRHLHCSGYTLLNPGSREAGVAALRLARSAGMTVSLDPASAAPLVREREAILDSLDEVDLLLANEHEASALADDSDPIRAARILAELVPRVVLKRGPAGALMISGGELVEVPAVPAEVVDTTGAGDAFAAGFLPSWLRDRDDRAALAAGCALAAQAISRVGGWPPPR